MSNFIEVTEDAGGDRYYPTLINLDQIVRVIHARDDITIIQLASGLDADMGDKIYVIEEYLEVMDLIREATNKKAALSDGSSNTAAGQSDTNGGASHEQS